MCGPAPGRTRDMLPLGRIGIRAERGDDRRTRFTPDEQRTLMTLWSHRAFARSCSAATCPATTSSRWR